MKELKECPFCGAKATIHKTLQEAWMVSCDKQYKSNKEPHCGASIVLPNKDDAIRAWNRREER